MKCSDVLHCHFVYRLARNDFLTHSESSWLVGSKHIIFGELSNRRLKPKKIIWDVSAWFQRQRTSCGSVFVSLNDNSFWPRIDIHTAKLVRWEESGHEQCCASGSGSGRIRNYLQVRIRIRFRIRIWIRIQVKFCLQLTNTNGSCKNVQILKN
jgi:hypothetical protein